MNLIPDPTNGPDIGMYTSPFENIFEWHPIKPRLKPTICVCCQRCEARNLIGIRSLMTLAVEQPGRDRSRRICESENSIEANSSSHDVGNSLLCRNLR